MTVVDTRSGIEMTVGQTVRYPDGESLTLVRFKPGLLHASALIRTVSRDWSRATQPLRERTKWSPLIVRWMHPAYLGRRVAFIPS